MRINTEITTTTAPRDPYTVYGNFSHFPNFVIFQQMSELPNSPGSQCVPIIQHILYHKMWKWYDTVVSVQYSRKCNQYIKMSMVLLRG